MIEIIPFHEELLPGAAELLARRHARDRLAMPLLPSRFETTRSALGAVRDVWHRPWTRGVAAQREGRLVGFFIGEARFDTLRGRHVWVQLAGHALAEDEPADLYADLYAAAGPAWLELGAFDHYVMFPAHDRPGLDVWFALSFGQEQVHALRSLDEPLPVTAVIPGVRFRRALESDRNVMVEEMSPILRRHLAGPPVWAAALPEYIWPMREGFAELLSDDNARVWLAEEVADPGRVLGYQAYIPVAPADDNLLAPVAERTVLLEVAGIIPEARRRGIGYALTVAGLADAKASGYQICIVDWRTTNIEASRFWPRLGFRHAVYRLTRKVDPRVAWGTV
jgi:ribosomal protein S18 acetylase RimI-like enzyme